MGSLKLLSQIYTFVYWLLLIAVFIVFMYRLFRYVWHRSNRMSLLSSKGDTFSKILKALFGVSMLLILIVAPFYVYIVSPFHSIIPNYLNHLLVISIIITTAFECFLALSISETLLQKTYKKVLLTIIVLVMLPFSIYLAIYIPGIMSYPSEEESYIVELPVRGTWMAGHAGESEIINYHSALEAQKYAMDIVKVNETGDFFENSGSEVQNFYTLGELIYSPVDGIIVHAIDSLSNAGISFTPSDTTNPAGNHVVIEFEESRYLFLAHLDSATVQVQQGDTVTTGDLIGQAGNSGNTSWPHLHMHIQDLPVLDNKTATAYPYRFDIMNRKRWFFWRIINNGYLLRNDLFENVNQSETDN